MSSEESPAHFETHTCWTFTEATSDADVAAELRRSGFYDAVPDEFWDSPGYLASFVPRTRKELQLEIGCAATRASYGGPPLACPISAFLGGKDRITRASMESWQEETAGTFALAVHPAGEHLMVARDAAVHAEMCAEAVAKMLAERRAALEEKLHPSAGISREGPILALGRGPPRRGVEDNP